MKTNALPSLKTLPIFVIACILALAVGALYVPGPWYESLNRAPWTPPNIAFPIVWTILYTFIALSGWQIFASKSTTLKWLWVIQLMVNAAWSWVFFGQHWVLIGLLDLLILDALVIAILITCVKQKLAMSVWLMTPYLIWLLIATSLNSYILIYN